MNIEKVSIAIASILISIITIISIVLIIMNFNNYPVKVEGFLGCNTHLGKISTLTDKRERYNNMNNNGRLKELKRGPIPDFHQQFTGGLPPELQWRSEIENKMNNLTEVQGINGELIQVINPIDNVYNKVNY